MSAVGGGSLQMSQGYEVLPPKSGKAYPIPCDDWEYLKRHVAHMSDRPWVFHTAGSALIGACLSTIITIITGTYPDEARSRAIVIAWAVVAVTAICGVVCLYFAEQQRRVKQIQAEDIVIQMELIEKRFDVSAV